MTIRKFITAALFFVAATASAQTPDAASTPPKTGPVVLVRDFDGGTVTAQESEERPHGIFGRRREVVRGYDANQLGVGIADLLVEKLLSTGEFRVVDRKAFANPDAATPANDSISGRKLLKPDYIIAGSITKLGFEEHHMGGFLTSMMTGGLVGVKQNKTHVALTARVVDPNTGEVVASFTGEGESSKGGGLTLGGLGHNGFGGVSAGSSNFRETAIGEATEIALQNLVEQLRSRRL